MTLRVVPEGLAAASARIAALTARLAGAHAGADPPRDSALVVASTRRWPPREPKNSVARASGWANPV